MNTSRYLLINSSGVVESIVLHDPRDYVDLPGYELVPCTEQADIGWIRNPDGTFAPPQSIEQSQEN